DPAPGRDEGFEGDRRHQQGRRGADLPDRRLRPGRRPVHNRPGTDREAVMPRETATRNVLIDGKAFSAGVRVRVADAVAGLKARGLVPGLAVVLVGEDPASEVYVRNKGI